MATSAQLTARLTQLNAAITAVETGGQAFGMDDAQYTRANLRTMYDEREKLEKRIVRLSGARPMTHTANFAGIDGTSTDKLPTPVV